MYGVEVWYTYVHKPPGSAKSKGSVTITNKLQTVQQKVAAAVERWEAEREAPIAKEKPRRALYGKTNKMNCY
jgi:hypothetical protein